MDELTITELFCLVDDFTIRFRKICAQEKREYSPKKCVLEGVEHVLVR